MRKHMKTILVLIAGFVLGVCAIIGGGWLYMRHVFTGFAESSIQVPFDAASSYAKSEREYRDSSDDYGRWVARTDGVLFAVDVLPAATVRQYATEVLSEAERNRRDWNYGNAILKANLALGRLALRDGDKEQAKHFLLEAGRTPGSPQLDSFGPNMLLAKEMLDAGERASVLEYLDLCSKFWRNDLGQISKWKEMIEQGEQPNFTWHFLD